ncbi:hypothetical protein [Solibacillus sp. FSL K6-1554]|uniref:hypothetical protein n=1 Tax=Solibacillus sp. FSL K6-1554 TaxID=2921472 RepID=UPI0030F95245
MENKKWGWLIVILVIGVGFAYMSNFVSGKYGESTVDELFKVVESDYSKDLYTTGTINYVSEEISDNKKITLSEENILNVLNQLEKTTVTGIKRNDLDALDIRNSYIVEFESKVADDLVFFVGRDENTQNVILEIMDTDRKLVDKYLVEGDG